MRISNILVIAATFLSSAHLAIAEDASFAFTEEKLAEADEETCAKAVLKVTRGKRKKNLKEAEATSAKSRWKN